MERSNFLEIAAEFLKFTESAEKANLLCIEKYKSNLEQLIKKKQTVDKTPQQNKKKHKINRTASLSENDENVNATNTTTRPTRKAALKAALNLKDADLGGKMRNENGIVKIERISDKVAAPNQSNSVGVKKEKLSILSKQEKTRSEPKTSDEGISSQNESSKGKNTSDSSVQIVQTDNASIVELSDDEMMPPPLIAPPVIPPPVMPPPNMPPPRASKRTKKARNTATNNNSTNESNVGTRSTRSKASTKAQLIPLPKIIKVEKIDGKSNKQSTIRNSIESVYEDANGDENIQINTDNKHQLFNSYVVIEKITELQQPSVTKAMDATYVNQPQKSNDETFKINHTIQVQPQDQTYKITAQSEQTDDNNSLLTEDNSGDENVLSQPQIAAAIVPTVSKKPVASKKKNELFNPCVESPLKKKVEAFEKLQNVKSTTNRAGDKKSEVAAKSKSIKPATPNHNYQPATKSTTPLQYSGPNSYTTPNTISMTNKQRLVQAGSSSKLAHLTRQNSGVSNKSVTQKSATPQERTREALDEKKKKNEEKMRQVQLQRDALLKEKMEKNRKILMEKDEKQQEAARLRIMMNKKQNDDLTKQLEIVRQKREMKKQLEREMAENARREKERIEQLRLYNEQKNGMTRTKVKGYEFDMLSTDDSTDDDSSVQKKRGKPPIWSTRQKRLPLIEMQTHLKTVFVDSFFSAQKMSPDLRAIFPNIEAKNLKRNSSAVWNTPPRYSQLPKY